MHIPTRQPFHLAQSIAFLRRFPPCAGDYVLTDDSITAAICVGDEPVLFTLSERGGELHVDTPSPMAGARMAIVARRAADFVGASDDIAAFYAAAAGDAALAPLIAMLHGLHHVRFLTLGEIAAYSVMMQRNPIARAAAMKRAFLARFGLPIGGLRALPELDALARLDGDAIGAAIRHPAKGAAIATVLRGVAALGEDFLRTAPYATAREALLEIPGIGPVSAGAILLRGLGRMDALPWMDNFRRPAARLYGQLDEVAIERRYGASIGYWSYYVMTGAPRLAA
jgi:DNA-3-methyladenine glycosylase II